MLLPLHSSLKGKAERANCASNLRNMFVATNAYLQEHENVWPQVTSKVTSPDYALAWIEFLKPYGMQRENWVCPTVQRTLKNPDLSDDKLVRIDYLATYFASTPRLPFRWSTQPWFAERGDVHGDGNLVVFATGDVKSLNQVRKDTTSRVFEQ
jgi:hypothetical protein